MTEPTCPFSQRTWSECENRERDAVVHALRFPLHNVYYHDGTDTWQDRNTFTVIPRYTQGECLADLLESELWPLECSLLKTDRGTWYVEPGDGYIPDPFIDIDATTPALAVCEAIVRHAWEKANDTDT